MNAARIPARIVCPDCGKTVTGRPVAEPVGAYRMPAHNRPLTVEYEPGQTCTENPVVRAERVRYAR